MQAADEEAGKVKQGLGRERESVGSRKEGQISADITITPYL